jgi:hypothetical protein
VFKKSFEISILLNFKLTPMLTVIVGSYNNGKMIATIDWTTMKYQVETSSFIKNRHLCSCGLLKNNKGQMVVAVAGKAQRIMKSFSKFCLLIL